LGIGETIERCYDTGGWPQDRVTECNMTIGVSSTAQCLQT